MQVLQCFLSTVLTDTIEKNKKINLKNCEKVLPIFILNTHLY